MCVRFGFDGVDGEEGGADEHTRNAAGDPVQVRRTSHRVAGGAGRTTVVTETDIFGPYLPIDKRNFLLAAPNDVSVDKTQVRALPGRALLPR